MLAHVDLFRRMSSSEPHTGREDHKEYEGFLAFAKSRRTIRAIKPDPVPGDVVERLLEAARRAPTGFHVRPVELLLVEDAGLRAEIRRIVDGYKNAHFFPLEATREKWQGSPWSIETHGRREWPVAPVMIAVLGDTRRRAGLPAAARYSRQKRDSLFGSSLSNAFMYLLLAARSLGLAAQPVSGVKSPSVQGRVKHLLDLPDHVCLDDIDLAGWSAMDGRVAPKLTRSLDGMVRRDRAADDGFASDEEPRRQIAELRAGNVARHVEGDRANG